MAILRRKLNGKAIGEADRGHIHHHLQDRGLSRAKSLLVISALCMVMAGVTLVSAYFQNDKLALGLCLALLGLLIVGIFGYDETILFFRYIQAMSTLLATTSGVLQTQLAVDRMAHAKGLDPFDHWNELTRRVEAMGGHSLEFVCHSRAGDDLCRLEWNSQQIESRRSRLAVSVHAAWCGRSRSDRVVARALPGAGSQPADGRFVSSFRHICPDLDECSGARACGGSGGLDYLVARSGGARRSPGVSGRPQRRAADRGARIENAGRLSVRLPPDSRSPILHAVRRLRSGVRSRIPCDARYRAHRATRTRHGEVPSDGCGGIYRLPREPATPGAEMLSLGSTTSTTITA